MDTDPALSQASAGSTADSNTEDSFHFTPIKALRVLPRLWERKPSTPFRNGTKSKKLWKRFHSSFSTMKTLDNPGEVENDALQTAINTSNDSAYVRGVKRLCVEPGDSEDRVLEHNPSRPFLETKWESEASRKRRKLPDAPFNIFDDTLQSTQGNITEQSEEQVCLTSQEVMDVTMNGTKRDISIDASPSPTKNRQSPGQTALLQDSMNGDNLESVTDANGVESCEIQSTNHEQRPMTSNAASEDSQTTTAVQDLTNEQEGKLVRSALRSSLDGEDALLLNDFLSKAKAKRAAKAAQTIDPTVQGSSPEDSPEECATPRSRRALGDIEINSPSPVKVQTVMEGDAIPGDEALDDVIRKDIKDDETVSSSPACRRSTRVKAPPADAPSRNTISLRRAKGTEFVFLQRTEAQELALATRRNTRKNKGNSVFPKHALQAMAEQNESSVTATADKPRASDCNGTKSRQAGQKHVSWNEERLVEFEDEKNPMPEELKIEVDEEKHDVGSVSSLRSGSKRSEKKTASSNRSSRSQGLQKGSTSAEPESASSAPSTVSSGTATPRSRRVRRFDSTTATGVSGTPVKTGSGRISKPPAHLALAATSESATGPSTPTKGRRKLVPKSPSSSMLPAPSTKPEPAFVSGIPTRSASNSSNSEGTKRKSMIQASAGCTPMPRRVRART